MQYASLGMREFSAKSWIQPIAWFLILAAAGCSAPHKSAVDRPGSGPAAAPDRGTADSNESSNATVSAGPDELGALCLQAIDESKNKRISADTAESCRKAAVRGHVESQLLVGVMYFNGIGFEENVPEAVRWLKLAAQHGNRDAMAELGRLYDLGVGLTKDPARATAYFQQAAELGSAEAQFQLGVRYQVGSLVPQDDAKAIELYQRAAENGDRDAQYLLSFAYLYGNNVPKDPDKAFKLLIEAGRRGHPVAQLMVARAFARIRDEPKTILSAVSWYEAAAGNGIVTAKIELAQIYLGDRGLPRDAAKAAYWMQSAAEDGNAQAQMITGSLYQDGVGVEKNPQKAAYWYGKASDQGDADAKAQLGFLYEVGRGVKKDEAMAFRLYQEAAAVKDAAIGKFMLGTAYANGMGTPKNMRKAAMWYERAALLGDATSMTNLGILYANGKGVGRNRIAGYALLTIGIKSGSTDENASRARKDIAEWMTAVEIEEATRLAANWKPGDPLPIGLSGAPAAATPADLIKTVQILLSRLGYNPGPADGVMNEMTAMAVRAFQTDQRRPATGKVTPTLEVALRKALDKDAALPSRPATRPTHPGLRLVATGSGFAITAEGHILTNRHVVEDCAQIWITDNGRADLLAYNGRDDLALLRVHQRFKGVATFRRQGAAPLAAEIVVAGYPLQSVLSNDLGVTTGVVGALTGLGGDPARLQVSAPVQPGNSGGPVLDRAGNVVGIVVSGLDAVLMANMTGDLPQNVNFAITASVATAFLDRFDAPYSFRLSEQTLSVAEVAAVARKFTVRVECWQ
jgi:TPR repeat protein/S1-C subfamily serine protease